MESDIFPLSPQPQLTHTWIRGENYLEIDCDVGSSKIASMLCGQVVRFAASVVVDLAFLIESTTVEELPERCLGNVRLHRPNLTKAPPCGPGGTLDERKEDEKKKK